MKFAEPTGSLALNAANSFQSALTRASLMLHRNKQFQNNSNRHGTYFGKLARTNQPGWRQPPQYYRRQEYWHFRFRQFEEVHSSSFELRRTACKDQTPSIPITIFRGIWPFSSAQADSEA